MLSVKNQCMHLSLNILIKFVTIRKLISEGFIAKYGDSY